MNQILKLREERANTWEMAKAFLESHRDKDGMVSAEDSAVYDRMEEKWWPWAKKSNGWSASGTSTMT